MTLTKQQVRKRMREVALLTFDGPLIDSLREYWASEVVELSQAALPRGVPPLGKQKNPTASRSQLVELPDHQPVSSRRRTAPSFSTKLLLGLERAPE
jgi:hypothetical protein